MKVPADSSVCALVPIRAGSKGFPHKNIAKLAGKPLYEHSVECARRAGIQDIAISTDIAEILERPSRVEGVNLFARPSELATDETTMASVLLDLLADSTFQGKTIVLLQATSPLRRSADILEALDCYRGQSYDLVMSTTMASNSILKYGLIENGSYMPVSDVSYVFSNRQQLPSVYRPNGAIYVFGSQWFLKNKGFETENIGSIVMPAERSVDIDTEFDLNVCEQYLERKKNIE